MDGPPPPRASKKARGTCSECRLEFFLHSSDGKLHLHGHRSEPCTGSGTLPLRIYQSTQPNPLREDCGLDSSNNTNKDMAALRLPNQSDPTELEANTQELDGIAVLDNTNWDKTPHPIMRFKILKRIPKAARPVTGRFLTFIINKILREADNPAHWHMLLTFGTGIMEQLRRGGKRHNLTATIKSREEGFLTEWQRKWAEITTESTINSNARKTQLDDEQSVATAAVASKLEDGNIRAAVRILCSSDKPANVDREMLEELQSKHPDPPLDRPNFTSQPRSASLQVSEEHVRRQLRSFPIGSSAGPDGIRPQHLLDLVTCAEIGTGLVTAITGLMNLLLTGTCPAQIKPILSGGTLIALRKKTGGLRPIVIGYYLRRLTSKTANYITVHKAATYLAPLQIGVGVPEGAEAACHAARRFLKTMPTDSIMVKLDFKNAFNSLHRDRMLLALEEIAPELTPYSTRIC